MITLSTIFLLDLTVQTVWYLFVFHFTNTLLIFYNTILSEYFNRRIVKSLPLPCMLVRCIGLA